VSVEAISAPRRRAAARVRRALTALGTAGALLLAGCAGTGGAAPAAGAQAVVVHHLPKPPAIVADCLWRESARVGYPRNNGPYAIARVAAGAGFVVEQWFSLGHRGEWVTRFELQPAGPDGTDVLVRMDTAFILAQGYARAAQELVAWCARTLT
jgi:hypothetical protein